MLLAAFVLGDLLGGQQLAAESTHRISFHRDPVDRPASRPKTKQLPTGLRLPTPPSSDPAKKSAGKRGTATAEVRERPGTSTTAEGSERQWRRGHEAPDEHPAPMDGDDLDGLARAAGQKAAAELVRDQGSGQYFRVGVFEGLQQAVDSASLGSWDYREGQRLGRHDRDARSFGHEAGVRAAEQSAAAAAADQVARQLHDLGRDPVRRPVVERPLYRPSNELAPDPPLEEVFQQLSPPSGSLRDAFRVTGKSPWQLYSIGSFQEIYDEQWAAPKAAFERWRRGSSRASAYRELSDRNQKKRFQEIFEYAFAHQLVALGDRIEQAYRDGYAAGWDYGAAVSYEWQYRRGYTEAYNEVLSDAAVQSFDATYAAAFHQSYEQAFLDWTQHARPELEELSLSDGNDDGIFEPGEQLRADYTITNFGGAGGEVELWLEGPDLQQPVRTLVRVRARQRQRTPKPVRAVVNPQARVRSLSLVELRVGDHRRSTDLLVSYPLELASAPLLTDLDTAAGRAGFSLTVVNRSRKTYDGVITLAAVEGYQLAAGQGPTKVRAVSHHAATSLRSTAGATGIRRPLGGLAPRAQASASFELSGLRPVDLLPGGLPVHFTTGSGGKVHDTVVYTFPDLVTDLGRRDLVVYLLQVAAGQRADDQEIAALYRMVERRLQADWQVAAAGKGNPYKDDFRNNGRGTALGDLVQSYLAVEGSLRNPQVINGLQAPLLDLSEQLPGLHPLLRRYFNRLVKQLH